MNYVIKRRRMPDKIKGLALALALALGPNYGRRTWSEERTKVKLV